MCKQISDHCLIFYYQTDELRYGMNGSTHKLLVIRSSMKVSLVLVGRLHRLDYSDCRKKIGK